LLERKYNHKENSHDRAIRSQQNQPLPERKRDGEKTNKENSCSLVAYQHSDGNPVGGNLVFRLSTGQQTDPLPLQRTACVAR